MQCTVSGDLPIAVHWLLNGIEIPPHLEVTTSKIGKRINVLSIESVKADHRGNYSCIATNRGGMAEFTAPLNVIGWFCYKKQKEIVVLLCLDSLSK